MANSEMNRRIRNAKDSAESSPEGTVSFLQVSTVPLVSLFITTGNKINKDSKKMSVELRFVNQHSQYPKNIRDRQEIERVGFEEFQSVINKSDEDTKNKFGNINFLEYIQMFYNTCNDIDSSKKKYHGVLCYGDGNSNNKRIDNCYFLHICDIMNLMSVQSKGSVPVIVVKTSMLETLPDEGVVNEFEISFLKKSNVPFLMVHLDFFYRLYCYYSNTSFMSIRTCVSRDNDLLKSSLFFMNDDHFLQHQVGKLTEFNQNEKDIQSKILYRSI